MARMLSLRQPSHGCSAHTAAQPAVRGVAVHARMPEHRHRDLGQRHRQSKAVQAGAQLFGVPLGHAGDEPLARASSSAAEKSPTITATCRSKPSGARPRRAAPCRARGARRRRAGPPHNGPPSSRPCSAGAVPLALVTAAYALFQAANNTAPPQAVATGMHVTFAVAAMLMVVALGTTLAGRAFAALCTVKPWRTRHSVTPGAACKTASVQQCARWRCHA